MIAWRSEEQSSKAEAVWSSLSGKEKEEAERAASKAMQLLVYRQRTEKELRQKLAERQFSPEAVEAAVVYVSSYGYLDDRRYAEVYLHSMQGKKSRALIARELQDKGVASLWIEEALAQEADSEEETAFALLCKKAGEPHMLDEKERRRLFAYLGRKGFSSALIWKLLRRFQGN